MDLEAERAELLAHLIERFGEEPVREAAARLPLFTVAVELSDPPPRRVSARAIAAAAGVPIETVLDIRAAIGFPVSDLDAEDIPETVVEDQVVAQFAMEVFGRDRVLAFTRTLGGAVQQIAEAARALFATTAVEDASDTGRTQLALSQQNELAWAAWRALPTVVEHTMIELGDRAQDLVTEIMAGDVVRAVGFVDLVGSTAWISSADASTQTAALIRFEQAAWEATNRRNARLVKFIGDEAMFVASDIEAACAIAADLIGFAERDPDLPPARGGVCFGHVAPRAGDYFGTVVNLTARSLAAAAPGTVVMPTEFVAELTTTTFTIEDLGPVELRGIANPIPLSRLTPRPL